MRETEFGKTLHKNFIKITGSLSRIFRNNTGQAWQGKTLKRGPETLTLKHPRPIKFGLCEGSSDYVGWHSIVIDEQMVGKRVAVFVALEAKAKNGKPTLEQLNFINMIKKCGGIAAVVKSIDDAKSAIDSYKPV